MEIVGDGTIVLLFFSFFTLGEIRTFLSKQTSKYEQEQAKNTHIDSKKNKTNLHKKTKEYRINELGTRSVP